MRVDCAHGIDAANSQRLVTGTILGAVLLTFLGLGLSGLWDGVFLHDLPVRVNSSPMQGILLGALLGAVWGLITSWPGSHVVGVVIGSTGMGVILWIGRYLVAAGATETWSMDEFLQMSLILVLSLPFFLLMGGVLRAGVGAIKRLSRNPKSGGWALAGGVCAIFIALGLGISYAYGYANYILLGDREAAFRVYEFSISEGWDLAGIGPVYQDSIGHVVYVQDPTRREYRCRVMSLYEGVVVDCIEVEEDRR